MKKVNEIPKEGQFVLVWTTTYDEIWCDTFRWVDGELKYFDTVNQEFINPWFDIGTLLIAPSMYKYHIFIVGDE